MIVYYELPAVALVHTNAVELEARNHDFNIFHLGPSSTRCLCFPLNNRLEIEDEMRDN
ncbi:hypothetical protein LguiA_022689 [Lonicera macranthoides]